MDAQGPTRKGLAWGSPLKRFSAAQADPLHSRWRPWLSTIVASWLLIAIIVIQALIAMYSIYILSAVRTYVGGESLWSKGQKDAIYQLSRYAETGDDSAYASYLAALKIPQGNRAGRIAIMHGEPDHAAAKIGFLQSGTHPDDVDNAIDLLEDFGASVLMRDSIAYWEKGDEYIAKLVHLGDEIHQRWQGGEADVETQAHWLRSINTLNAQITPFAAGFTSSLGRSSRLVVQLLMWGTACTALMMGALVVWRNYALIMQRERVQRVLDNERKQAKVTLVAIGDGVVTTDAQGHVRYMNPAAERILAITESAARGKPLNDVLRYVIQKNSTTGLYETAANDTQASLTSLLQQIQRHDGQIIAVRSVTSTMAGFEGDVDGQVVVLHDATQEQSFLQQVSWHANHDSLTSLLNRRAFESCLQQVLSQPRESGAEGVLLFIDIDQFKLVNDTCGHQAGDFVLREICGILQSQIKHEHALARLGGDEFGVLLFKQSRQAGLAIAEQLRHTVRATRFRWHDRELSSGLSIGMVLLDNGLDAIEEVLRVADMACYQAKEDGRNRVCLYEPQNAQFSRLHREMDWIRRLRNALDTNRFELYAQPILDLRLAPPLTAGTHVELLLRLRDEHGHIAPPSAFIPAAELYGLMPEIDRWVIKHAFAFLATKPQINGHAIEQCAINLSATSIGEPELLDFISEQFASSGLNPALICFEITETSAITNLAQAQCLIASLRKMGCRFALDDFGAGMSSFCYLRHLQVDYLKIDGSLIIVMQEDPSSYAMVEMINHLAQLMRIQTIAEFAATPSIIDALRKMGVGYAQGYGFSPPMPFMAVNAVGSEAADSYIEPKPLKRSA